MAFVDKLGTAYEDPVIATGYGAYIATPLLRTAYEQAQGNLTEEQALAVVEECLRVLYYRDARSHNKVLSSFLINSDLNAVVVCLSKEISKVLLPLIFCLNSIMWEWYVKLTER